MYVCMYIMHFVLLVLGIKPELGPPICLHLSYIPNSAIILYPKLYFVPIHLLLFTCVLFCLYVSPVFNVNSISCQGPSVARELSPQWLQHESLSQIDLHMSRFPGNHSQDYSLLQTSIFFLVVGLVIPVCFTE